jgi:hypothetical protein
MENFGLMRNPFFILLLSLLPVAEGFAQQSKLDTTTFVTLGEGLAAGMADFSLRDIYQLQSFPALIAKQIKTDFPQPLIEPPGIGSVPGFQTMAVTVPARGQSTVREWFPPTPGATPAPALFIFNLSVPGLKVADSIGLRPVSPLIQKNNPQQTVVNMILGYPALLLQTGTALWSQLEYAQNLKPTLALVELGYFDVLDAAANGDPTRLPDVATFQTNYTQIVKALTGGFANVIVTTIPNPMDTAYFTTLPAATRLVGLPAATIAQQFHLQASDLLTAPGLMALGSNTFVQSTNALPAGSVVSSGTAAQITARVAALNSAISTIAQQNGAILYDLNAFFARARTQGVTVGTRTLTADFQGGLYSLDGYYPGTVVHALIANDILALLNKTFSTSFATVDPTTLLATDPAVRITPLLRRPRNNIGGDSR